MRPIRTRHPNHASRSLSRLRVTGAPAIHCGEVTATDDVSGYLRNVSRMVQLPGRRVSARWIDGTRDRHAEWEAGFRTTHPYG